MKHGLKLVDIAQRLTRLLAVLVCLVSLAGCDASEGTVEVDVGQAPLAAAYRVDLYAQDMGLPLIEGKSLVSSGQTIVNPTTVNQETGSETGDETGSETGSETNSQVTAVQENGNQVTFDGVPPGRWSVFIQAQNGDQTTIAHYIGQIVVHANEVTTLTAGAYIPGLPGDTLPESERSIASFGPDGKALLTAIYAPGIDRLPPASVTTTIENGPGQVQATGAPTALARRQQDSPFQGCGTAWLTAQEPSVRLQADSTPSEPAPKYGSLAPGATATFYIATSFRQATCVRLLDDSQTEHCLIFAEVVDGAPVLNDATALNVARAFDSDNPFVEGDRGVYQDSRARFGSEWNTNPVGGRDGDERVILVFLSSNTIGGEGLFGFFRPDDEQARTTVANSNEAEIIFLNSDRANGDLYDALSTISHEFTHLILFNQKVAQDGSFPEGAPSENVTLDEGFAVLNEDLSGFSFTGPQGGSFFLLSAVQAVLEDGLNRPFFQFRGGLDDYGAGYLLCRYLHDRFGPQAVREMTTSTSVGRENIAQVVELPFPAVFVDFAQAVALNGEPDLSPELSFTDVDLYATYVDRAGAVYELDGLKEIGQVSLPGTLESQVTLEPWGAVFYRASGGDGSGLAWKATGIDSLLTDIFVAGGPTEPTASPTP